VVKRVEIEARPELADALAVETVARLAAWLSLRPARVRTRKVFHLDFGLGDDEATQVLDSLVDPVAEVGALGNLPDALHAGEQPWVLSVGFLPGVTDSVGKSVALAAEDRLGRALSGRVYSSVQYSFWGLDEAQVQAAADQLLYNPMIQRAHLERAPRELDLTVPSAGTGAAPKVEPVKLLDASDEELLRLSKDGMLALSLAEMQAIQAHYREQGRDPWDAELECLAQTWSEHCKHKIFASPIDYVDPDGQQQRLDRGLFRTYIRGATEKVAADRKQAGLDDDGAFLVSVFHDNAGVVRFTGDDHLVYKVETHNSPSALDPYGGAMTGIVGVNRDSFGTGLGADLLTNVWGYCLGDPRYDGKLPKGLMHPRRIRDGVHRGVIDGGNQSGIPYSRGFELFDDRYAGKPLVYCGTVAVMPVETAGRPTHEKRTAVGDKVVMIGGRIGKDGIHGATFSSVELDESAPVQAVQIGDPITQKMMFDMLAEARDRGLYSGMTDNGAGGLSSSVGEMAEATGGACIDLAKAPVKYPGLDPWEILISEAQERMSVAIPPDKLDAFLELARRREVEASVLGEFTDDGYFDVRYGDTQVARLSLEFMHSGVPLPVLSARWDPPKTPGPTADQAAALADASRIGDHLLALLARPSLSSDEDRARNYDHEVKGLSVIKPFLGKGGDVPATATVMRARHGRSEGVVLGEGIHPFYGDVDADAMARACVDEAVRRVLCAGARMDRLSALDNFCWPDPIVSDKTPDGEHKLAQLVRCCQGLYSACVAYGLPLISGKDSMKNDANIGGVKISIPPTLLVSVMGQMRDVAGSLSLEPRAVNDVIYVLGHTGGHLGGSELARLLGVHVDSVATTDVEANASRYKAFVAVRDSGLVRSAHAVTRGGLLVALSHMAMASELSIDVDLAGLGSELGSAQLAFSESTGRILVTVRPEDVDQFETALAEHPVYRLGEVKPGSDGQGSVVVRNGSGDKLADVTTQALRAAFKEGLHGL
jgi:phosphoribosylformylglycinamidine synthase